MWQNTHKAHQHEQMFWSLIVCLAYLRLGINRAFAIGQHVTATNTLHQLFVISQTSDWSRHYLVMTCRIGLESSFTFAICLFLLCTSFYLSRFCSPSACLTIEGVAQKVYPAQPSFGPVVEGP